MAADVFEIIQTALRSCVSWTTSLFDSTGMGGIVTAVFILGLIISFFLMPFRGVAVTDGSGFGEFARTSIHKAKHPYRGKFTKEGTTNRVVNKRVNSKQIGRYLK